MPSYKPRITIYTTEEITKKLAYISKVENREIPTWKSNYNC